MSECDHFYQCMGCAYAPTQDEIAPMRTLLKRWIDAIDEDAVTTAMMHNAKKTIAECDVAARALLRGDG